MRSLEASGGLVAAAAVLEEALALAIDAFQLRYALISSCHKVLLPEVDQESSHMRQEGEYS